MIISVEMFGFSSTEMTNFGLNRNWKPCIEVLMRGELHVAHGSVGVQDAEWGQGFVRAEGDAERSGGDDGHGRAARRASSPSYLGSSSQCGTTYSVPRWASRAHAKATWCCHKGGSWRGWCAVTSRTKAAKESYMNKRMLSPTWSPI